MIKIASLDSNRNKTKKDVSLPAFGQGHGGSVQHIPTKSVHLN